MKVIFFTGPGISVDSGIPVFRKDPDIRAEFCRKFARKHPKEFREMMMTGREFLAAKEPNAAHIAIAETGWPVITMATDGLHEKAGSKNVVNVRGTFPTEEEIAKASYISRYSGKPSLYGEGFPGFWKACSLLRSLREGDCLVIVGSDSFKNCTNYVAKMAYHRNVHVTEIYDNISEELPAICSNLMSQC